MNYADISQLPHCKTTRPGEMWIWESHTYENDALLSFGGAFHPAQKLCEEIVVGDVL